jgi:hypothetical protein
MANSVKVTFKLQYLRDSVVTRQVPLKETTIATTSEYSSDNTQLVGTTHELIAAGDVTDDMMAVIENIHATAIVSVGGDAAAVFVPWFFIPPGERAVLPRLDAVAAAYLKSDTASTPIKVTLIKIAA